MKRYLIEAGRKIVLADRDPGDTKAFDGGKEKGLKKLQELNAELQELQELLEDLLHGRASLASTS